LKLITPVSLEYIRAYNFFEKSILPQGRGWVQESKKFLDAMIVLENEIRRLENEQASRLHSKLPHKQQP
jgi:hypothetical protein